MLAIVVERDPARSGKHVRALMAGLSAAQPHRRAVALCAPPTGHTGLMREAFDRRLDLRVEKPPTASASEAEHIVAVASPAGRRLNVS